MCRAKLKGKVGVYCLIRAERSWKVRWECTVEDTVRRSCCVVLAAEFCRQPINAVHSPVVLCDLAYLSSEQAALHCSQRVCSAGRPAKTVAVIKAGGYQSGDKSWEVLFERYVRMNAKRLNSRKEARQMLLIWSWLKEITYPRES